jgi:hypothetical protein
MQPGRLVMHHAFCVSGRLCHLYVAPYRKCILDGAYGWERIEVQYHTVCDIHGPGE